jgi:hypothetical protein
MRGSGAEANPYADGLVVVEPQRDGPVLGSYANQPIAEAVVDCFGRRFVYAGVAPRRHNGRYDFGALAPGEWIVEPGLVYSGDGTSRDSISIKSRNMPPSRVLSSLRGILNGWFH